ncbi:restriction endonuclease subunit S [Mycolicibacterium fortuitum]
MSRIDDLTKRLCPNGVPFRTLGEIGELVRGNGMPKTDFTTAGVGAIHYGQIYTYYGTWTTKAISFVAPETAARLAKVDSGDVIITNTSENIEDVGKAVAWLGSEQIVTGGHATVFKHSQNPKFIAYWLQTPEFQAQKKRLATGTKVIDVSAKALQKIRMPLPPPAVQSEIVSILDQMEELAFQLESELESELESRSRQYAYYRDTLLSSANAKVRWAPMGEVGQFIRGRRFTKGDVVDVGIPSIHYGEIYTYYGVAADSTISHVREELADQLRFAEPGDVVIAAVGETVEDVAKAVAWMGDKPVAIHDDTFLFRSDLHPKFVSYFTQTANFHGQKNKHVARAKVKRLSSDGLAKILIPVPTMDQQRHVVGILDKFDVLVKGLTIGIQAEILARRRQYEFYRDLLLTFEEAVA